MIFELTFKLTVPLEDVVDESFERRMTEFGKKCVDKMMEICPPGWSWEKERLH